jgi:ubiquinone/menaquinone biosynthesis C-methylase UbiE
LNKKLTTSENTLNIAPEPMIELWLRKISKEYLSIDLNSSRAMKNMDITNLKIQDNQYSLIWCFHVLEHIENDNKAMNELYRVLSPSGLAIIAVPIYGEKTYENKEIKTPEERLVHFKQKDHVRLYGLDIVKRLEHAGFSVEIIHTYDCDEKDILHFGLEYPSTKEIFICKK